MKSIPLFRLALVTSFSLVLWACSKPAPETVAEPAKVEAPANPLLAKSTLPFEYPPFNLIKDEHYPEGLTLGMQEQAAEFDAIANNTEAATFDNTILALEKSGELLARVSRVFFSVSGAHTNDALQKIQADFAPKLSAHRDSASLNEKLFARVQSLYDTRDTLGLDAEGVRLVERYYTDFVRDGAKLNAADKEKLKALNADQAGLQTTFSQNLLKETNASAVVVDTVEELAGLSTSEITTASEAAAAAGHKDKYLIALKNTSQQPWLSALQNRALRERLLTASLNRASQGGEFDNRAVLASILKVRAERAALLGYANHATYVLEDVTAGTVEAVNGLLLNMAPAAVANARKEAAELQKIVDAEKGGFQVAAWDWDFYAEKYRKQKYDFDEAQIRPYFEIDNVLNNGVFFAANKLYGLTFKERTDLPVYQEDVRTYDVFDADGSQLAIFVTDFYARTSKRGGAWANAYVPQNAITGTKPVIANHLNVPKPPKGEPTLLTSDEVRTMFHEFGHALHGMFSNVKYPRFGGTSVPRDFVEYPSQVNEMWATWPEVLANYAKHYQTGEAVPQALVDKMMSTSKFNQGYSTTENVAASLLDQAFHQISADQVPSAETLLDFEAAALKKVGLDYPLVPPRYRSTYFSHIVGGYSSGYYSYLWSEQLDAESVLWFNENGGLTRANGDHFRNTLLSKGGSVDAMQLFRDFRGRDPEVEPLLRKRGLMD